MKPPRFFFSFLNPRVKKKNSFCFLFLLNTPAISKKHTNREERFSKEPLKNGNSMPFVDQFGKEGAGPWVQEGEEEVAGLRG
jgi:hypothetical protein